MINTSVTRITYVGDTITKEFPYTFPIIDPDDIVVVLVKGGEETVLTKDYYVDTNKKSVYYPGYPPGEEPAQSEQPAILDKGEYIILRRETKRTQESELGSVWPYSVIETALDKLTMIVQELRERQLRSINVSETAQTGLIFPDPQDGSFLIWKEGKLANKNPTATIRESEAKAKGYYEAAATSAANAEADAKDAEESRKAAEGAAETAGAERAKAEESEAAAAASESQTKGYRDQAKTYSETIAHEVPAWDKSKTYNYPDIVAYLDGHTYRCISESTGENPSISRNWVNLTGVVDDFFVVDENGDLTPAKNPYKSNLWTLDGEGNITPRMTA